MNDFFKDRVTRHQKMIQRYLKYIFNDHFAFSMMILVGGSALYYSNLLKTLPAKFTPGIFIVLVVWLAALQMGRFASLAKPADMVFLLPKEKQMRDYLAASLKYSCYFPLCGLTVNWRSNYAVGGGIDRAKFFNVSVDFAVLVEFKSQSTNHSTDGAFSRNGETSQKCADVVVVVEHSFLGIELVYFAFCRLCVSHLTNFLVL
jgi:Predicted ABC-type exoprotein transport system, permease component